MGPAYPGPVSRAHGVSTVPNNATWPKGGANHGEEKNVVARQETPGALKVTAQGLRQRRAKWAGTYRFCACMYFRLDDRVLNILISMPC